MPALTWALTWQIAASLSSFSILVGFIKLIHTDYLSTDNWCRLWFGLSLMFLIALSTPIFHVRYRAPAVVALLLAINLVHPNVRKNKLWMSFPTLIGTTVAILNTI